MTPKRHFLSRGRVFWYIAHETEAIGLVCSLIKEPVNNKQKYHGGCNMLGIRRTETPNATIMKIGSSGGVPYLVAVVRFCRYRLTGVGVAGPGKVAF